MENLIEHPANWLVAHRGDRAGGVENTLAAFSHAITAGARFAECDIQFTRDMMPVVLHDNWLKRLCHNPAAKVINLELAELYDVCLPNFELLTLDRLLAWLELQAGVTLFIEIKATVRRRTTDRSIARRLTRHIPDSLLDKVVLISKSGDILDACKAAFAAHRLRIGWVAEGNSLPVSDIDYIFMPYEDMETFHRWQNRGVKVGLYTINDVELATEMRRLGADLIESDHFSHLLGELDAGHDEG